MPYDEQAEIRRYIWGYCKHLITEFEKRVDRAALAREKADGPHHEARARLFERWSLACDPDVDSALSAGWESFRRSVCRRILTECGDTILNRCPRCRRIVRTPRARQCFWCGHGWHGPSRTSGEATTDG